MSRRDTKEITIWNAVTPVAVTSSTDATPIVVTATAHALSTGDTVMINGHTTNIAANGVFRVTRLTSSTYSLQNVDTGANVAGSGGGAGSSGVMVVAPKMVLVEDFGNAVISIATSGSANFTARIGGSIGRLVSDATNKDTDRPNFGATQSAANPYSFIQIINLDTAAAVNGATGITTAGTDLHNIYEININGLKYFTPVLTAWSAGVLTMKAQLYDNL